MLLQAILVSRDVGSTGLITSAFRGAVIDIRVVREIDEVVHAITATKFDALIADYGSVPEAPQVLAALRKSPSNHGAIAFAVIDAQTDTSAILQGGADFVLQKPLNAERVTDILRVARERMLRERRRYLRHGVEAACWMKGRNGESHAQLRNVSEGGIGIEVAESALLEADLRFRFTLPDADVPIDGKGELAWTREARAGIRFTALTTSSRETLQAWLDRRFDRASAEALRAAH